MDGSAPMTLRVLTPDGAAAEVPCDLVQLTLRDGADGTGGGLVGVQRGHAPAVLALAPGRVRAALAGRDVYLAETEGGFASVLNDVVTVLTDLARP